ncbi:hypothetical protein OUZ56_018857 [Daphnia magna]|uniref:Uncharacterized protein n=1 Tax=Daphnia magna TaxID=35525 RepID=A0ABQ9ZA03_9CRUS|nr:hypothetical protein OUZ56_018857 [Daphnia magna]
MSAGDRGVKRRCRSRSESRLGVDKTFCGASRFRAVDIVEKEVNCSTATNHSYYNSQKLLQNQQQQTIALLAQNLHERFHGFRIANPVTAGAEGQSVLTVHGFNDYSGRLVGLALESSVTAVRLYRAKAWSESVGLCRAQQGMLPQESYSLSR